jgi:hypothetical protein
VLLGPFLALLLAACAGPRQPARTPEDVKGETKGFQLVVTNRQSLDVNVFVQHDGQVTRLSTVTASSEQGYFIPEWMLGQSRAIRLIAEPVGAENRYSSELITVQIGQLVQLNVEPSLKGSYYSVQ